MFWYLSNDITEPSAKTFLSDVFFSTGSAFLLSWAVDLSIFSGKHPEGGSTWEFVVGVRLPVSPNPDPISDQNCHFIHPFSDLASKIRTLFQT